jgi:hypothetical protein
MFAGVYFEESDRNDLATDNEAAWRQYAWPLVGAYTSFMRSGLSVVALNRQVLLEEIEQLSVLYMPYDRENIPVDLEVEPASFEARGGVLNCRDSSLRWDDPLESANAHSEFETRIQSLKASAAFWVAISDDTQTVYPFLYVD